MSIFTLAISFDHFKFALIHGPDIPGSNAILLFTALDLASITSHIHSWVLFLLSAGGCDWCTKCGRKELPTSEVRGRSWEDPMPEGWRPRGATRRPRSGSAAERSYPSPRSGRRPRGATPRTRSGGCVGTGGPRGATQCSRSGGSAVRRYPSSKVRSSPGDTTCLR